MRCRIEDLSNVPSEQKHPPVSSDTTVSRIQEARQVRIFLFPFPRLDAEESVLGTDAISTTDHRGICIVQRWASEKSLREGGKKSGVLAELSL